MLHIVKTTILTIKRMPLLSALLSAMLLALHPISAQAQCAKWDASGDLKIKQHGQFAFDVKLEHKGKVITGTANSWIGSDGKTITGPVDGTIEGDDFRILILWNNYTVGVYTAKILPSGRLEGEGYERNSPNVRVPWHSETLLRCPASEWKIVTGTVKTDPAPAPKPIARSGRKPPPAPPLKPPFITANPLIGQPQLPFGSVILAWDGGPDHPNVEVWVSIDNAAEVPAFSMEYPQQHPLFKQPKAGFEIKLSKGRLYKYILKDAGTTLSTVVFTVQQ
jgi:hypothetical protein